jgi:hypothetical protein
MGRQNLDSLQCRSSYMYVTFTPSVNIRSMLRLYRYTELLGSSEPLDPLDLAPQ